MNKIIYLPLLCLLFLSCNNDGKSNNDKSPQPLPSNNKTEEPGKKKFAGPLNAGYDWDNSEEILLPDVLNEVSGIGFYKGNEDTLYAEQDEEGKLYYLHPGDKKASHVKFGKKGDYEDLAIFNNWVVMLRSDGILFSFPFSEARQEEANNVKKWELLLPEGEYEGLYGDESENRLYVLCKQCADDKTTEAVSVYILQLLPDGTITKSGAALINVKAIGERIDEKKLKFHPSALARNPQTKEWYILSSVNKLLVIADSAWNITDTRQLDPGRFRQPEGIAFDRENNLYISNEGDKISKPNLIKLGLKK